MKPNKFAGYDNINANIIKKIYEKLKTSLMNNLYNLSLSSGILPDKLKIANVSPVFKNGEKDLLTNISTNISSSMFLKKRRMHNV